MTFGGNKFNSFSKNHGSSNSDLSSEKNSNISGWRKGGWTNPLTPPPSIRPWA